MAAIQSKLPARYTDTNTHDAQNHKNKRNRSAEQNHRKPQNMEPDPPIIHWEKHARRHDVVHTNKICTTKLSIRLKKAGDNPNRSAGMRRTPASSKRRTLTCATRTSPLSSDCSTYFDTQPKPLPTATKTQPPVPGPPATRALHLPLALTAIHALLARAPQTHASRDKPLAPALCSNAADSLRVAVLPTLQKWAMVLARGRRSPPGLSLG